jgi:hypothetical protein
MDALGRFYASLIAVIILSCVLSIHKGMPAAAYPDAAYRFIGVAFVILTILFIGWGGEE